MKTKLLQRTSNLSSPSLQQWDCKLEPQAGDWAHLFTLPNPYSYDEGLLLCQCSEQEWLAWIPDHGEAVIEANKFCVSTQ